MRDKLTLVLMISALISWACVLVPAMFGERDALWGIPFPIFATCLAFGEWRDSVRPREISRIPSPQERELEEIADKYALGLLSHQEMLDLIEAELLDGEKRRHRRRELASDKYRSLTTPRL